MNIHFITAAEEDRKTLMAFQRAWKDNNSFITQHTSGSTGTPKPVDIPKWKFKASARATGNYFDFQPGENALLCISPAFIGGKMMYVRSLEFGMNLYVAPFNRLPLEQLNVAIDFAAMVPLQVAAALREHPEKLNLIRQLIIGGAPVSATLEKQLQQFEGTAYSTYGMTETVSHVALRRLNNENAPYIGLGDCRFQTTAKQELIVHAPHLNIDHLKTNDVVELIDERSFRWLGRSDFTINSGGIKIQPEQVEKKLADLFPAESFLIGGLPDEKLGSRVIWIGEKRIENILDEAKIRALLDKYERPKAYFFVDELTRTSNGKIDRHRTIADIHER